MRELERENNNNNNNKNEEVCKARKQIFQLMYGFYLEITNTVRIAL